MFAILVGDAIYLHSDLSTKTIVNDDTIGDRSRKHFTPQPLIAEKAAKPSSTKTA
jgi:hypothetical protein